jgi:hypothetical protein
MQFILPLIYCFLFIFLILKMKFFESSFLSGIKLALLFVMKLIAASAVWLIYTYYYHSSDFSVYFSDSSTFVHNLFHQDQKAYSAAWTGSFDDAFFKSSRFMITLNGFLHLFSFGNFYVHALFFCFFSFLGLTALLKAFEAHYPAKKNVIIALFFIPSILFWGSSPLKESIIIGAVGLLIYYTDFGLKRVFTKKELIIVTLMISLLLLTKIYILFALFPVMVVNMIVSRTSDKKIILKYLLVFVFTGIFLALTAFFRDDLNILKIISDKQAKAISEAKGGVFLADENNFISIDYNGSDTILQSYTDNTYRIRDGSTYFLWKQDNMSDTAFITNSKDSSLYKVLYRIMPANSVIPVKKLKPELLDYVLYSPVAFGNTLLRPTFFEIRSWLHLVVAVENTWILLLLVLAICFFDKRSLEKKQILFFCLVFSLIVYVLVGISAPAIGAMVRYKTIGLLFLAAACFLMIDEEKMKKRILRK